MRDYNSPIFSVGSSFKDSHIERSKLVRDVNSNKRFGSNFNDTHPLKFNVLRDFNSPILSGSSCKA